MDSALPRADVDHEGVGEWGLSQIICWQLVRKSVIEAQVGTGRSKSDSTDQYVWSDTIEC